VRLNVAYTHLSHHAAHSGYDQVVPYLVDRLPVARLEADVPRHIPWRAWRWADRRWSSEWYDVWSLSLEASAARRLLTRPNEIVHLLYGEDTYRHLGRLPACVRRRGARVICTYHQPPEQLEGLLPSARGLTRMDAVVALAEPQAQFLAERIGADRVFVVPHGVDTTYFRPANGSTASGATAGHDPTCLFVGSWLRDFETLEKVVRLVAAREPGIRFRIVTSAEQVTLLDGLPNVERTERVSDEELLRIYQSADLFLLPLVACTANNSLLEAMACGLPLVASDVGGVREYVDDSCAVLVPASDPEAMADSVISLCSDDRRRAEMSSASRARALELDWSRVADRLIDVYEAVGSG
jgi:glycosyltransferase involved in cell wall biosynthesis